MKNFPKFQKDFNLRLHMFGLCFTSVILLLSEFTYGEKSGSLVDVAWQSIDPCKHDNLSPCLLFDSTSEKKLLLVGDSHASHFFNEMQVVSSALSVDIYWLPYVLGSDPSRNSFTRIIKNFSPQLLLISQFNNQSDYDYFYRFKNQIDDLLLNGIDILYISDNPVFTDYLHYLHGVNPGFLSSKLQSPPISDVKNNDIDQEAIKISTMYTNAIIDRGISYINLYSIFCDEIFCSRFKNDIFLFFDDHHLTLYGASLIRNDLIQLLEPVFD